MEKPWGFFGCMTSLSIYLFIINYIKHRTYHFREYSPVALSTVLCSHRHHLAPELSTAHLKAYAHQQLLPNLPTPLPQPTATISLLSVSVDLFVLDILYERTHTICGLLLIGSFTLHNTFKVLLGT